VCFRQEEHFPVWIHMRDPDGPENKANYPSAQFTAQSDIIMNYYKLSCNL